MDRRSRSLATRTLVWYQHCLAIFHKFVEIQHVEHVSDITSHHLRSFLLALAERGHNAGGIHNIFGAVKAFLLWYGKENGDKEWISPLRNVVLPRRSQAPLDPLALNDFRALLNTCCGVSMTDARDRALLLLLMDTGVRQQELLNLKTGDVDLDTGNVLVRCGKGGKFRITFIGAKTRRALTTYLQYRMQVSAHAPLWLTRDGKPLSVGGIREIIRRRARAAGIDMPGLHAFRRAFALNCLRNGMDVISLQRIMGHTSPTTLQRYLALLTDDLRSAHMCFGVVDRIIE
jgi:site-specific recombinase XerD